MGNEKIKLKISATTTAILLVVVALALTLTTIAALSASVTVPTSGSIATSADIDTFADAACTVPLNSIDWGALNPGGSATRTAYIKNTGTGTALTLSMATSNWNPATANGPLTVTWNKEGAIIAPGQSVLATFTLTVSPTVSGINSFAVQINITGTA